MPEIAVDQNNPLAARKHKVWPSWEAMIVFPMMNPELLNP
jgi:hypothetical protein